MVEGQIPADLRQFIQDSITSVPHLEAILLLRAESAAGWNSGAIARRLYVSDETATQLLLDLAAVGIVAAEAENDAYRYRPHDEGLRAMIDRLALVYARNIVAVTNLIHSSNQRKAKQFSEAFRLRKGP